MPPAVRRPEPSVMDRMVQAAVEDLNETRLTAVSVTRAADRAGVPAEIARAMFPDDESLDEAVGTFGILQLSDAMTRALMAAPQGDNRAALMALGTSYIAWARAHPALYHVLTYKLMQPARVESIVHRYDASFVPLVRRFLGEGTEGTTRRAAMARSLIYGLTDLSVDNNLDLWLSPGSDPDTELAATLSDFIDLLLAQGPDADPATAEA